MGLPSADDAALRRFLLGDLTAEARERLEERLLTDSGFYDLLLVAEDELLDDYVLGVLSPEDREKFASHFLSTPERQRKLEFAGAFRTYVVSSGTAQVSAWERWRQRSGRFVDVFHPRFGLYAAASLLVALASGALWSAARIGGLHKEVDRLGAELALARASVERSLPAATEPARVTSLLVPGLLRGAGGTARVVIPADAILVELQLELGAVKHERYRAVLMDAEGDEIWTQGKLGARSSASRDTVSLFLPSTLLPAGDYILKLYGVPVRGAPTSVGTYSFRAVTN